MKEKVIKRLLDIYGKLVPLSIEAEKELKSNPNPQRPDKLDLAIKFENLKALYNQFFLLTEIVTKDLEVPLTEIDKNLADYHADLMNKVEMIKDPKAVEELKKLINPNK